MWPFTKKDKKEKLTLRSHTWEGYGDCVTELQNLLIESSSPKVEPLVEELARQLPTWLQCKIYYHWEMLKDSRERIAERDLEERVMKNPGMTGNYHLDLPSELAFPGSTP